MAAERGKILLWTKPLQGALVLSDKTTLQIIRDKIVGYVKFNRKKIGSALRKLTQLGVELKHGEFQEKLILCLKLK